MTAGKVHSVVAATETVNRNDCVSADWSTYDLSTESLNNIDFEETTPTIEETNFTWNVSDDFMTCSSLFE